MFRVFRGTVKGILARVSANRTLGAKGKLEKVAGRMQCKIGRAQAVIGL
jgi:uncharacterized protein YjbJ (UPF0337 family)